MQIITTTPETPADTGKGLLILAAVVLVAAGIYFYQRGQRGITTGNLSRTER